jgi:hypothetical protein
LNDTAAPLVADHAGATKNVQMIGQRGSGQTRDSGQFTDGHAFIARLYKQAEQIQAVLLGQGAEAGESVS